MNEPAAKNRARDAVYIESKQNSLQQHMPTAELTSDPLCLTSLKPSLSLCFFAKISRFLQMTTIAVSPTCIVDQRWKLKNKLNRRSSVLVHTHLVNGINLNSTRKKSSASQSKTGSAGNMQRRIRFLDAMAHSSRREYFRIHTNTYIHTYKPGRLRQDRRHCSCQSAAF